MIASGEINLGENEMGLYNKYEEYDAEDEAARRKVAIDTFLASDDTHLLMLDKEQKPTVKIENNKGFYSADCPYCGKIKILSGELKTLSAVCNKCYYAFNLEN